MTLPDQQKLVLKSCACVRLGLHFVPDDEHRLAPTIEAAELWAKEPSDQHWADARAAQWAARTVVDEAEGDEINAQDESALLRTKIRGAVATAVLRCMDAEMADGLPSLLEVASACTAELAALEEALMPNEGEESGA